MGIQRGALTILCAVLALLGLTGCGLEAAGTARRPVAAENTTPTVGDSVRIAPGRVTLESVTTTAPPGFGRGLEDPTLWLNFRFVNTTDGTVTVSGFRGAPPPQVTGADGTRVDASTKKTTFTGGTGGFGLLGPEAIYLGPKGVVVASFGLRPTRVQYVRGHLPLKVIWRPTDHEAAAFEVK